MDRIDIAITMTSLEARIGLTAFALLLAGLAVNLLGFQGPPPHGPQKARTERGQPLAQDKSRRLSPSEDLAAVGSMGSSSGKAAVQDGETAEIVRAIQRELQARGYNTGAMDGVPALMTRAAVMAYEFDHGLPLTGDANEDSLKRILLGASTDDPARQGSGGDRRSSAEGVIRAVQVSLSSLGYNPGAVDGRMREATQRAIRSFESDSKLPETGRISGPLIAKLGEAAGNGRLPGRR